MKIGSTVCVESDFMVAIGEVRHRMLDAGDAFRVGVEIVEMLSDETAPRRRRSLVTSWPNAFWAAPSACSDQCGFFGCMPATTCAWFTNATSETPPMLFPNNTGSM